MKLMLMQPLISKGRSEPEIEIKTIINQSCFKTESWQLKM